jgi:lipopolysaccharide/colanic/teichoic acid biosynthesis glycosyltransferase
MKTDYDGLDDGLLLALIEAQERLNDDERLGHAEPTSQMIEQAAVNLRARLNREDGDALLALSHSLKAAVDMGQDERLSFHSPTRAEVAHAKAMLYRKLLSGGDGGEREVRPSPRRKQLASRSLTVVSSLSRASSGLRTAYLQGKTRGSQVLVPPAAPRVRVIEAAPPLGPPEQAAVEDWHVSVHEARRDAGEWTGFLSVADTRDETDDVAEESRESAEQPTASVPPGWTRIIDARIPLDLPEDAARSIRTQRFYELRRAVKIVFDYTASASALVVLSPLFAGIAVVIRVTSPGPAFFTQTRVGQNGQVFRLIKFRTMYIDADIRLAELVHNDDLNPRRLLDLESDPRITPIGRVLRKYSVNEFPQLLNVVTGSMSIVGPRPHYPNEVSRYSKAMRRCLLVKPGATGLWQVSGRGDLTWDETEDLDLRYIDEWSLRLDWTIIWKTLGALIRGDGAY